MILQMYIGDKLVDSSVLSLTKISDVQEREWYIQGAINQLLEHWSDLIKDQDPKVEFFIKGQFPL
ncbi:MAG TPA: hypothetical protein VM884_05165 [Flavisolibacter sp.]|jgi:hypothetical protein|nr:hypothetical protein [Flavisolibacter sp.]